MTEVDPHSERSQKKESYHAISGLLMKIPKSFFNTFTWPISPGCITG